VSYVHRRSAARYLLTLALLELALLAKAMPVTLPCALLLLDCWPLKRCDARSLWPWSSKLIVEKLPMFALVSISCAVMYRVQIVSQGVAAMSWAVRLQNVIVSYSKYLWMMFVPHALGIYYPHPGTLADPPRLGLGDERPGRKRGGEKLLDHERDPVRARRELHDLSGTAGEPRHDATMATTSCRSSGASWTTGETRLARRDRASSNPAVGGRSWGTGQDLPPAGGHAAGPVEQVETRLCAVVGVDDGTGWARRWIGAKVISSRSGSCPGLLRPALAPAAR